jgi:NAD(P)-dependent dehydrogenase (short-subunit alcohol dehydrogenase family)
MEGLSGKVVVFGGAGGIADGVARVLGAGGATVVVGDVALPSAERAVGIATDAGGAGVAARLDLRDESSVAALVDLAVSTYGRVDGLFNVAANIGPSVSEPDTDVVDIAVSAWQRTVDVNLTGYMLMCKHAIPHMLERGGSIVNTISGAAYSGDATRVAYQSTKAGITALTRHVAGRFGKARVRANCVAPGMVLTEVMKSGIPQAVQDEQLAALPSWRLGEPADLGAATAFLLSDLGEWITGQVLSVDGGATMRA